MNTQLIVKTFNDFEDPELRNCYLILVQQSLPLWMQRKISRDIDVQF